MTDKFQSARTLGMIRVEPFKGEELNADFAKWAKETSRDLLAGGVDEEKQRVRLLLTYMDGRARLARNAYYAELDDEKSKKKELEKISELITYFAPKFQQPNSEIILRQRLNDLKQVGSIEEYILQEEEIVGSVNFKDDFDRMYHFMSGLKKDVLKAVMSKNPRTFDDLKQNAINFVNETTTGTAMMNAGIKEAETPEYMDLDYIKTELEEQKEQLNAINLNYRNQNSSKRQKIVYTDPTNDRAPIDVYSKEGKEYIIRNRLCFNCGKHGHTSRECRGKVNGFQFAPRQINNNDKKWTEYREPPKIIDVDEKTESEENSDRYDSDDGTKTLPKNIEKETMELSLENKEDTKMIDFDKIFSLGNLKTDYNHPEITTKINNKNIKTLLDSGATSNFISVETTKNLNLKTYKVKDITIKLADGKNVQCDMQTSFDLTLNGTIIRTNAFVID
ncbi:hypothetical protein AX774_g6149 [Zancudomyces culisetae]|uniref:CCHC-type domain-containing protein n=1 Tax=Zancudomyces culisetae TaxID=1213189 RepID=A0A1R1PHG0_ZANCU|nr:hypothetical protein AX774_g6149 [Zancudomyces culisetae]|eukprot:OMH80414.1 hypothetical protein AX774_g6149 [Zancudomyces culisetae]